MFQKLAKFFERRSQKTLVASAVLLTLVLGVLDLTTGLEVHFLFLYLLPIFVASWFVTREVGVYLALFASVISFAVSSLSQHAYSAAWIPYWNLVMHTGVFVLFAVTQAQLRSKMEELSNLATRDFLTGLPNGHAFYQLAAKEMDRAFGLEPLTLACIDIAGFRAVNLRFGYPIGDQMMCSIAHTIRQNSPRPDLVGRVGGTSFVILLPNIDLSHANFVLQKLQTALHEERRKYSHPLTFFISAIACARAPRTVAELMQEADAQMLRVKGGGNRDSLHIAEVNELPPLN